ncbi:putative deoxyribonuclease tatdn3 [Quaeritorhiza haematococci]|nr:putative deoxyribonuclease tatdn3 [Quaeritorhiza haematococci]
MSHRLLIDTHAHLYPPEFPLQSLAAVLERAKSADVAHIITVSETFEDARTILSLCNLQQDGEDDNDRPLLVDAPCLLRPAAGLHPAQHSDAVVEEFTTESGDAVKKKAMRSATLEEAHEMIEFIGEHHNDLVAVGEIGLDFTPMVIGGGRKAASTQPDSSSTTIEDAKILQREVFALQIRAASEYNLPITVHSRSAGHHAVEVLYTQNASNVVLHAYDGAKGIQKALQAGYYFSIPPSVVRSDQKKKLIKTVPLDRLTLESDSPALAPVAGEVNEPKNMWLAVKEIAQIKGCTEEEVVKMTTENALRVFTRLKEERFQGKE